MSCTPYVHHPLVHPLDLENMAGAGGEMVFETPDPDPAKDASTEGMFSRRSGENVDIDTRPIDVRDAFMKHQDRLGSSERTTFGCL